VQKAIIAVNNYKLWVIVMEMCSVWWEVDTKLF